MLSRVWLAGLLALALAGCAAQPAPLNTTAAAPSAKRLATAFYTATPDAPAQAATARAVAVAAAPTPSAVPTASPTPYIGVFLGEADTVPVFDPALLNAQLGPTPTSRLANCRITPDAALGTFWQADAPTRAALGCPIEPMLPFDGVIQVYERGFMLLRPGTPGQAFAVALPGAEAGRHWYFASAPEPQAIQVVAPPALRAPSATFTPMWQNTPPLREALGYAQTGENAVRAAAQRFEGGTLLTPGEGQVYALLSDNTARGPY